MGKLPLRLSRFSAKASGPAEAGPLRSADRCEQ